MNKELWTEFHLLHAAGQEAIRRLFRNSPVMEKLIQLVGNTRENIPQGHLIIAEVYGEAADEDEFRILRNRYYKLRKKLLAAIREQKGTGASREYADILPEEAEFFRARRLMATNDYRSARTVLEKLLKAAEALELLELLPEIYSNLGICSGVFNEDIEARHEWVLKFERANLMRQDFDRLRALNKHAHLASGRDEQLKQTPEILAKIRRISQKYPESHRFSLAYHFCAANLSQTLPNLQLNAIRRHLNRFRELREAHPAMPVFSFEPGHEIRTHYHYVQMEMIYHWLRQDYEMAYQFLQDYWEAASGPFKLYLQLSQNAFLNKANLEIRTERFSDAAETMHQYIKFLKENRMQDKTPFAWTQIAFIYARAWPGLEIKRPEFVLKKIDEAIEKYTASNHQRLLTDACCTRPEFLSVLGRHAEALEAWQDSRCRNYYQSLGLELMEKRFALALETDTEIFLEGRKALKTELKLLRKERPEEEIQDAVNFALRRLEQLPTP